MENKVRMILINIRERRNNIEKKLVELEKSLKANPALYTNDKNTVCRGNIKWSQNI